MTNSSLNRPRWLRSILAAFGVATVVGVGVWADGPDAKGKTDAPQAKGKAAKKAVGKLAKAEMKKPADDAKTADTKAAEAELAKAAAAVDAARDLQTAIEVEAIAAKIGRPARTVSTPTLDSAAIDAMLDKALIEAKTPVSPATSDEEFVRRVFLDVTGKLPTIEQMRSFVHSRDKAKRAKLIEMLLTTPAYADNWARYWRDVVSYRAPNEQPNQTNFPAFEAWLTEQFLRNRPWDEIASDIITANGTTQENGAASFAMAESVQAVELAGEVSRVFMGVQIQCAQCHDHPSDKWKRQQFHEFAAFFAGISQKRVTPPMVNPQIFEVRSAPNVPRYSMPDLKDPTKQNPVNPKFFLGENAPTLERLTTDQRRAVAASYVTGQDNPWFAKAFVNRVWGVVMGEGFYNPVDDIGSNKEAHNPEVLEALAAAWQQGGYDIKWLFRTILNTRAYQRESRSTNSAAGRTPFASNCPTRLRADQIFDALAQALDLPPETFTRANPAQLEKFRKAQRDALMLRVGDLPKMAQDAIVQGFVARNAPRTKFNKTFGVDPSTPTDDVLGTIPQALFLMNSPAVNNGLKATPNSMLGELLRTTPDNRAVLNVIYLRVLAREPNGKEVRVCGNYIENVGNRVEAFEDILWSLVNSTEFLSRR
jgi:hypothetical protein